MVMSSMPILSIRVKVGIWILGFTNWMLLERSCALLSFPLWINVAKLLCSCLCLFDAIIELNAMGRGNI